MKIQPQNLDLSTKEKIEETYIPYVKIHLTQAGIDPTKENIKKFIKELRKKHGEALPWEKVDEAHEQIAYSMKFKTDLEDIINDNSTQPLPDKKECY